MKMLFFRKKQKTKVEKDFDQQQKRQKELISLYSPHVETGFIVSTSGNKPNVKKYVIEFFNVGKFFFNKKTKSVTKIFQNVNLKVRRGEFVVIFGKTGQGKSTLLNIMSGFEKATTGDVFVNGYNLSLLNDSKLSYFYRDNVSFVFQEALLLNEWTPRENIEISSLLKSKSSSTKGKKQTNISMEELLELVEIGQIIDNETTSLSGGEKQRVNLVRALSKNFDVLFCDEPTGSLDDKTADKIFEILEKVNKIYNKTVIVVTHNKRYAKFATRQVFRLKKNNIEILKRKLINGEN